VAGGARTRSGCRGPVRIDRNYEGPVADLRKAGDPTLRARCPEATTADTHSYQSPDTHGRYSQRAKFATSPMMYGQDVNFLRADDSVDNSIGRKNDLANFRI